MKILVANLKHLYQRRGLLVVWMFLGFFSFCSMMALRESMHSATAEKGEFAVGLAIEMVVGWIVVEMLVSVLAKPFSFSLPGHRQAVRQMVFLIAMVTSLAGSMMFLFYPGLTGGPRLAVLCSVFLACLATCAGTAWLGLHSGRTASVWLLLLLLVIILGSQLLDLHILLERAIVEYPLTVIVASALASLVVWISLGNRDLARDRCLTPWLGWGEMFSLEKTLRVQKTRLGKTQWEGLKDHPRPWVENLFVGRMARQRAFSTLRFVWGQMYVTFGLGISGWSSRWVLVLMFALIMGLGGWGIWVMWTAVMVGVGGSSRPALYSKMLVAGGRRERFYSTLAVTMASAFSLTLLGGAAILVSIPLANILPELAFKGVQLRYQVIDARMLYIPLVCVPLAVAVRLIFYPSIIAVVVVLGMLFYVPVMIFSFASRDELPNVPSPAIALALASLCWLAFGLILNRLAMRRCLVK
jgi:hypothetical protein